MPILIKHRQTRLKNKVSKEHQNSFKEEKRKKEKREEKTLNHKILGSQV